METTFPGNLTLFALLNAGSAPNPAVVRGATLLAVDAVWLVIAALLVLWVLGSRAQRRALMVAGVALLLGLGANRVLATLIGAARPFVHGIGNTLLAHGSDPSFPSDHTTFLLALGFALAARGALRGLGGALIVLGLAVGWARVYLGVHFPLDIAGSIIVALVAAALAEIVSGPLDRPLFARVERANAAVMRLFGRARQ